MSTSPERTQNTTNNPQDSKSNMKEAAGKENIQHMSMNWIVMPTVRQTTQNTARGRLRQNTWTTGEDTTDNHRGHKIEGTGQSPWVQSLTMTMRSELCLRVDMKEVQPGAQSRIACSATRKNLQTEEDMGRDTSTPSVHPTGIRPR